MMVINQPYTEKEGALNDKLERKKLLIYMKSVYRIPEKINTLEDKRKRKSIPFFNVIMVVLISFILQYESFHEIFTYDTSRKRFKNVIKGRIPKTDAARLVLKLVETTGIRKIHESIIKKIYENKTLRKGTIAGYVVAAIDGVELFQSTKKNCKGCLVRKLTNGVKEHYHRSVVCMTVGSDPHIIIGQEMLHPRDGKEKDEGELTGGKRLIKRLYETHHHFADVIVADALYVNAPFINTVHACRMEVVIRAKDEKRLVIQDAAGLFKTEGRKKEFTKDKVHVQVWDVTGFQMEGVEKPLRVLKFVEQHSGEKEERIVWIVTSLMDTDYKTIWTMMHKRWDIEENGFHQLKTYYHAKHCFEHAAVETIFMLNIIAFNLREMYLFRRMQTFRKTKMTRREVSIKFKDDLLLHNYRKLIYDDG